MDSFLRARGRQRFHLLRCRIRRRNHAAAYRLSHVELWLALVVLGFSAVLGLVAGAIWYVVARDTPGGTHGSLNEEAVYIASGLPRRIQSTISAVPGSAILSNRDIARGHVQLFLLRLRGVHLLQLVLHLSERRTRFESKAHSAYYTMLPFLAMAVCSPLGGWLSDRLTKRVAKRVGRCILAAVAIGFCAIFIALGTQAESAEIASVLLAGGAGALYISQSSFWSVSADIGGKSAGLGFRLHEYGRATGRHADRELNPAHRQALRLDGLIPRRGRPLRGGRAGLAPGSSGRQVGSRSCAGACNHRFRPRVTRRSASRCILACYEAHSLFSSPRGGTICFCPAASADSIAGGAARMAVLLSGFARPMRRRSN